MEVQTSTTYSNGDVPDEEQYSDGGQEEMTEISVGDECDHDTTFQSTVNMNIDHEVFGELPAAIQQEILLEQAAAEKRATDAAIQEAVLEAQELYEWHGEGDTGDDDQMLRPLTRRGSNQQWACTSCTFVNHPQLDSCEMCETSRPLDAVQGSPTNHSRSHSTSSTDAYETVSKRVRSSSMAKSLKMIRVPATPAFTSLTQSDEPTAEDLLIAATVKIQTLQHSAAQSLQQAKKSLFGKSMDSTESSVRVLPTLPSDQALVILRGYVRDLNTKCEPGDPLYESLLVRLWNVIYQDEPPNSPRRQKAQALHKIGTNLPERREFERVSEAWVEMGFQGPNPDTDFRGGGLLALKCLVFAFEAYPYKMQQIVALQRPQHTTPLTSTKWYPVCTAGINVTCLLASLLKLGSHVFERSNTTYWPLFEEPSAFYHLFSHVLIKMDAAWHRMNATYMEFGVVLKATRHMACNMLDQSPQTLNDLRQAADKTFVDRFITSASSAYIADTEAGECPDPHNILEDDHEVLLLSPRANLNSFKAMSLSSPPISPTSFHTNAVAAVVPTSQI